MSQRGPNFPGPSLESQNQHHVGLGKGFGEVGGAHVGLMATFPRVRRGSKGSIAKKKHVKNILRCRGSWQKNIQNV